MTESVAKKPLPPQEIALAVCAAVFLLALKAGNRVPFGWPETLAFVTGGLCVWLTVRENIWNWPLGITNSAFFVVLFWQSRLFADMALNGLYVVLGVLGWYWWLHGGAQRGRLTVRRIRAAELLAVLVLVAIATPLMQRHLEAVNDAAPFLDALTTTLSLAAQYLLTRKFFENWFFWIAADLIYIPLYWSRGLHLTAVLYAVFLLLCCGGVREWRRTMEAAKA